MKYRNVITGMVISTPCKITGKNWEKVEDDLQLSPEVEISEKLFDEETAEEEPTEEATVEKPKARRGKK